MMMPINYDNGNKGDLHSSSKIRFKENIFLDYSFVNTCYSNTYQHAHHNLPQALLLTTKASSTTMTAATTVRSPPRLQVDFWGETPSKETISPMPLKCPNHQCAQAGFFVHGIKGGQQHHRLIF